MDSNEFLQALDSIGPLPLTPTQFERAGLLIAIFGSLGGLFDPVRADEWPRRPNEAPPFDGRSALELMQTGGSKGMVEVLRYLQAAAQGL